MEAKIVLGVIGADCHSVGNKILDYAFSQEGFKVTNIGVLSSQEEFINAAIETNANMIVVSSLYGHGELDCRGFKEKCIEAGLEDVKLYVGGNLVVGKQEWEPVEQRFKEMGFDRVYPPGTKPEVTIRHIREDLGIEDLGEQYEMRSIS
ncbi:methylaspartate mutase subunit S [Anaeromicrobium sediminis]|uniref:Glutamate mutase sigma subunit n=1 Tax=Anaeromicrobium sediminis TaxID=1478221 RepID=A0A267MMV5_9FIRM|nr:methylaspartate mutase subunit S [Anaeromicrobium sediminis]PAB60080.1 methylaspartate mutase subunit S [Anaeromicrobium sediminis]